MGDFSGKEGRKEKERGAKNRKSWRGQKCQVYVLVYGCSSVHTPDRVLSELKNLSSFLSFLPCLKEQLKKENEDEREQERESLIGILSLLLNEILCYGSSYWREN